MNLMIFYVIEFYRRKADIDERRQRTWTLKRFH